eukprot:COSAG05_NODE_292_length_12012_cov_12.968354_12_plen_255_part_00
MASFASPAGRRAVPVPRPRRSPARACAQEGTPPPSAHQASSSVVMPQLSRAVVATLGKIYEGVPSRHAAVSLFSEKPTARSSGRGTRKLTAKELGFELSNQLGVRIEPAAKLLPVLAAISNRPSSRGTPSGGGTGANTRIGLREFLTHRQEFKLQKLRVAFCTASYGVAGSSSRAEARMDASRLFRHYDRSNGGALSFEHFKRAVKKDGHCAKLFPDDAEILAAFEVIDADGDGQVRPPSALPQPCAHTHASET